jgi:hypothetical protein
MTPNAATMSADCRTDVSKLQAGRPVGDIGCAFTPRAEQRVATWILARFRRPQFRAYLKTW